MSFGHRLRKLRNEKKLKQEDLAKIINISKSSVGMYERNEREPSFEVIKRISDYFNVSIDYLINGENSNDDSLFFFDMNGLTEQEIEDIKEHIEYVKWKAQQKEKWNDEKG